MPATSDRGDFNAAANRSKCKLETEQKSQLHKNAFFPIHIKNSAAK
jgi:hypothetical protein